MLKPNNSMNKVENSTVSPSETYEIIPEKLTDGTYVYMLPLGLTGNEKFVLSSDQLLIPEVSNNQGGYKLVFVKKDNQITPVWTPIDNIVYSVDGPSVVGLGDIVYDAENGEAPSLVYYNVAKKLEQKDFDSQTTYKINVTRAILADAASSATLASRALRADQATNAVNAQKADEATYASSDHTKGTIEERLTSLGFKEGSFTISDASIKTTKTNVIKKQGNRCIANVDIVITPQGGDAVLHIPEGFRPSTEQYMVIVLYDEQLETSGPSLLFPEQVLMTITTDGRIVLPSTGVIRDFVCKIFNAGWEL